MPARLHQRVRLISSRTRRSALDAWRRHRTKCSSVRWLDQMLAVFGQWSSDASSQHLHVLERLCSWPDTVSSASNALELRVRPISNVCELILVTIGDQRIIFKERRVALICGFDIERPNAGATSGEARPARPVAPWTVSAVSQWLYLIGGPINMCWPVLWDLPWYFLLYWHSLELSILPPSHLPSLVAYPKWD
jgi:hypothetical protein